MSSQSSMLVYIGSRRREPHAHERVPCFYDPPNGLQIERHQHHHHHHERDWHPVSRRSLQIIITIMIIISSTTAAVKAVKVPAPETAAAGRSLGPRDSLLARWSSMEFNCPIGDGLLLLLARLLSLASGCVWPPRQTTRKFKRHRS